MNCKSLLILFLLVLSSGWAKSQIDDNMVPNPDFEDLDGKIRKPGDILVAKPWFSPTEASADLLETDNKKPELNIPLNTHGSQKPQNGEHYAGVRFYSYKNKKPRTYITVEFFSPLVENANYCVSFNVSLGELCKYAVNNIGANISKKNPEVSGKGHLLNGTTISKGKNEIVTNTEWLTICGVYKAKGGEKYITIGNFEADGKTDYKKMKKSKEFMTSQQTYDAYYYVEGVNVTMLEEDEIETCKCETGDDAQTTAVIFSKAPSDDWASLTPKEKIESSTVYFTNNNYMIAQQSRANLDTIAKILLDNPEITLKIIGNSDKTEVKNEKESGFGVMLAGKRANKVIEELVALGIEKSRFTVVVNDDKVPADDSQNDIAKAKNRRVDLIVQ